MFVHYAYDCLKISFTTGTGISNERHSKDTSGETRLSDFDLFNLFILAFTVLSVDRPSRFLV